jgi:hypothetical protein
MGTVVASKVRVSKKIGREEQVRKFLLLFHFETLKIR